MVDLHIHTRNSSGTDSLEDILKKAENKKLKVISITDNENIEIYDEVKDNNVRNLFSGKIITGTEIKTMFDGVVIDVLAYDFDPEKLKDSPIVDSKRIRLAQYDYLDNFIKVGKKLGLKFSEDIDIKTYAAQAFYDELIKHKENFEILPELKEKKEKFFKLTQRNRKSPFYINESKDMYSIGNIINEVHKCGGKVFLAHLYQYDIDDNKHLDFAKNLFKFTNIDGMECYYPTFSKKQTEDLVNLTKEYDKCISGGSGYHGTLREGIDMGSGDGNLNVPENIVTWVESKGI